MPTPFFAPPVPTNSRGPSDDDDDGCTRGTDFCDNDEEKRGGKDRVTNRLAAGVSASYGAYKQVRRGGGQKSSS